jgi:heme/copper-type cytochrome/quinol oxidase subunit 2
MNLRSILALFLGAGVFFCSLGHAAAGSARIVAITAIPSRFSPDTIVVHAGETTTLRFSVSGVHGLYAPELGITHTLLSDGQITDVTIAPVKAGAYVVHCRIFCGPGHADMTLTIVVEP